MAFVLFATSDADTPTGSTFAISIAIVESTKLMMRGQPPHTVIKFVSTDISQKKAAQCVLHALEELKQTCTNSKLITNLPLDKFQLIYEKIIEELGKSATVSVSDKPSDKARQSVDISTLPAGMNWILLGKKSAPITIPMGDDW